MIVLARAVTILWNDGDERRLILIDIDGQPGIVDIWRNLTPMTVLLMIILTATIVGRVVVTGPVTLRRPADDDVLTTVDNVVARYLWPAVTGEGRVVEVLGEMKAIDIIIDSIIQCEWRILSAVSDSNDIEEYWPTVLMEGSIMCEPSDQYWLWPNVGNPISSIIISIDGEMTP